MNVAGWFHTGGPVVQAIEGKNARSLGRSVSEFGCFEIGLFEIGCNENATHVPRHWADCGDCKAPWQSLLCCHMNVT